MVSVVRAPIDTVRQDVDRWCLRVAAFLVAVGVLHLVVFAVDDRPWDGPLSWRKPATFGEAFGVTLATVVWVSRPLLVPPRWRARLLAAFAADCVLEVAGITVQAWRDVPSHLNTSTPFNAAVAALLAVGGGVLVMVLGTFAYFAVRRPIDAPPDMALAIRAGWLFLMAGLAAGAAMIAVGSVAMRTGDAARAYVITGFLKGFHGLTIHALLTIPAVAWVQNRLGVPQATRGRVVVLTIALLTAGALILLAFELATV